MFGVKDWEGRQRPWARQLSERGWRLMETNVSCFRVSKGDWGRVLSPSPQGISHFGKKRVWIYSENLADSWTVLGSSHTACQVFYRWQERFGQSPLISPFFKKKKKIVATAILANGKTWKQEKHISHSQPLIELQNWDNDANEYY